MGRKAIYKNEEERRRARVKQAREWRRKNLGSKSKDRVSRFCPAEFGGNEEAAELARLNSKFLNIKLLGGRP